MKKFFSILSAFLLVGLATFGVVGCAEENPYPNRQHVAMLIVDQFGQEWCELTEEENHKTITLPTDEHTRTFTARAKFSNGDIRILQGKNAIGTSYDSFTPVNGDIEYDVFRIFEAGTYELRFMTNSDNTEMFPFTGYLTVVIPSSI